MGALQRRPEAARDLTSAGTEALSPRGAIVRARLGRWWWAPVLRVLSVLGGASLLWGGAPSAIDAQTRPGAVVLDETERYYELEDTTLTQVIARLNRMQLSGAGGRASQGLTEYHIQPSWRPVGAGGRCRIANLTLTVQVVITLPSWPGHVDRPDDEQASWSEIREAIRTHEYRHRDLTVDAAESLAVELATLETRGCRALEQAFAGQVALAGQRLREAHERFDRETPVRLTVGEPGTAGPGGR